MTDKTTLGIGIIGTGTIAPTHAQAVDSIPEAELVAACDIVESRVVDFADRFGVRACTSAAEILADPKVQAVLVCTPPDSHCPLAEQAAAAGVHVMVEKPLTMDLQQADAAIKAAEQAGIKFGVIFQRRFWDAAQRARQAIDDGKIGKVILGDCAVKWWRPKEYYDAEPWRGTWDREGGAVLVNQAIHAIDMYQWLMGPIDTVYGLWGNLSHPYIEAEDVGVAALRFKNGALGTIEATVSVNPQLGSKIAIHGSNGATLGILEHPEGSLAINDVWTIPGEEKEADKLREEASRSEHDWGSYHTQQIRDFVLAITEDREPAVTAKEGRKSIEIVKAIYESARIGRPVSLPL
jgi:UDP-N-acetyl-2-amino-2-deoxyglucuronate dehydrogenase